MARRHLGCTGRRCLRSSNREANRIWAALIAKRLRNSFVQRRPAHQRRASAPDSCRRTLRATGIDETTLRRHAQQRHPLFAGDHAPVRGTGIHRALLSNRAGSTNVSNRQRMAQTAAGQSAHRPAGAPSTRDPEIACAAPEAGAAHPGELVPRDDWAEAVHTGMRKSQPTQASHAPGTSTPLCRLNTAERKPHTARRCCRHTRHRLPGHLGQWRIMMRLRSRHAFAELDGHYRKG